MRLFPVLALLVGCNPWVEPIDVGDPALDLDAIAPGRYDGEATLEVRIYAGPVLVRREICTTPMSLRVDGAATWLVAGEVTCPLEEYELVADVHGDSVGLPYLAGEVVADDLDGSWDGWFVSQDELYGDIEGDQSLSGLRLRYVGFMEAGWAAPLSASGVGG